MKQLVSDFVVGRLRDWGVRRVFAYPGDGINGITGAFARLENGPRFIQVRHEEMAAFMACAHAKFTGEVGVCMATSGPGAIHLLNGLYDAKLDHQPVVAIVGQSARSVMGSSYQQEVDLLSLFKDVAGSYVQMVTTPEAVRHTIDRAFRIAIAQRTVTCVIVPHDVADLPATPVPAHAHDTVHSSVGVARPVVVPRDDDLQRAAEILNDGERVAILAGAGTLGASEELMAVADALGACVAKALLGKAVLPDDLPYVTGSIGLLGTAATADMMSHCDTLLMVGTSFPYAEFLPKEGKARAVQIDIDPQMLGLRYPTELNLVGDSAATLRALLPRLTYKTEHGWRTKIESWVAEWWKLLDARANAPSEFVNPELVFAELSRKLPDYAIIAGDAGSSTMWLARYLKMRRGMSFSLSGRLASMGSAIPYAIAAKFAFPLRAVFAIAGDGAMQMNGINELITVAKYWREWKDPRFVVIVINNRDLNMVTWEMRALEGNPKFPASQDIPDFQYAAYARSLGFGGTRVENPSLLGEAFQAALSADRPYVIEAVTDPDVPMLPPHVSLDQARSFFASLRKGDVDTPGIVRQSFREIFAKLIESKSEKN